MKNFINQFLIFAIVSLASGKIFAKTEPHVKLGLGVEDQENLVTLDKKWEILKVEDDRIFAKSALNANQDKFAVFPVNGDRILEGTLLSRGGTKLSDVHYHAAADVFYAEEMDPNGKSFVKVYNAITGALEEVVGPFDMLYNVWPVNPCQFRIVKSDLGTGRKIEVLLKTIESKRGRKDSKACKEMQSPDASVNKTPVSVMALDGHNFVNFYADGSTRHWERSPGEIRAEDVKVRADGMAFFKDTQGGVYQKDLNSLAAKADPIKVAEDPALREIQASSGSGDVFLRYDNGKVYRVLPTGVRLEKEVDRVMGDENFWVSPNAKFFLKKRTLGNGYKIEELKNPEPIRAIPVMDQGQMKL